MEVAAGVLLCYKSKNYNETYVGLVQIPAQKNAYDIPGGRRKPTQSIRNCAIAETLEETRGLINCQPRKLRRILCFGKGKKFVTYAYQLDTYEYFCLRNYDLTAVETDNPEWHETSDLNWARLSDVVGPEYEFTFADGSKGIKTNRLREICKILGRKIYSVV